MLSFASLSSFFVQSVSLYLFYVFLLSLSLLAVEANLNSFNRSTLKLLSLAHLREMSI